MKFPFKLLLSAAVLATVPACAAGISPTALPSLVTTGPSLHGVFEGITPCSARANEDASRPAQKTSTG